MTFGVTLCRSVPFPLIDHPYNRVPVTVDYTCITGWGTSSVTRVLVWPGGNTIVNVPGPEDAQSKQDEKAERRAARETIAAYHQQELRKLLEHVRTGFTQLDAGEIDEFELDDLIHHYKRSAAKLWSFCEGRGGVLSAASALAYHRERGEEPNWWEAGTPWRDRSPDSR